MHLIRIVHFVATSTIYTCLLYPGSDTSNILDKMSEETYVLMSFDFRD